MNTQLSLFIVSVFVGLWVISNIIETTAFDEVYPLSYPGICKQRLRINTLCDKLENDVNKHPMKNSAGLIPPPNMSNDISKKMDGYLHHDNRHGHHDNHHHLHEYIEEEPHPDDIDLGNEDDSHSNTNILSRFAHGLLLFTILSLYCIYMSGRKNERNHYDGRVLPVYN